MQTIQRENKTVMVADVLNRTNKGSKKPIGDEYDHIILSPEEELYAIRYFKMMKAIGMDDEERKRQSKLRIEKAQAQWSYDELREVVLERAKTLPFEFILDEQNERMFHLLCLYFSGDARFNDEKFVYPNGHSIDLSLNKGIGLVSTKKGTGKTILMSLFQQNKYRPFFQIETKNVSSYFQKRGDEAIEIHSELLAIPPEPNFFYYSRIGICFGDLGFELPKNFWGTKSDVMSDVLITIYNKNQMKGDFSCFHFTSNLSGKDIEERYDDRVRDRMREMFNVLVLTGESRRK